MPSHLRTLLRENAINLRMSFYKNKDDKQIAINNATEIQNEILYVIKN